MAASSLKNEMVILRNECDAEAESLYIQALSGVAGQTIRNTACRTGARATIIIQLMYWTAKREQAENNRKTKRDNLVLSASKND